MNTATYQRCTTPGSPDCTARSIEHRQTTRTCLNCLHFFHAYGLQQKTLVCSNCISSARRAADSTVAEAPESRGIAEACRAYADYVSDRRRRGIPMDGMALAGTVAEVGA